MVVGVADVGAKVEAAMKRARKVDEKQMKADTEGDRGRRDVLTVVRVADG